MDDSGKQTQECSICKQRKRYTDFAKPNRNRNFRLEICDACRIKKVHGEKQTKECVKCDKEKPFTEFYKAASNQDGLYGHCKKCQAKMKLDTARKLLPEKKAEYMQKASERAEILRARSPEEIQRAIEKRFPDGTKTCIKCKEVKKVDEFTRNAASQHVICGTCKRCETKRTITRSKKRRVETLGIKAQQGCEKCGTQTPGVLKWITKGGSLRKKLGIEYSITPGALSKHRRKQEEKNFRTMCQNCYAMESAEKRADVNGEAESTKPPMWQHRLNLVNSEKKRRGACFDCGRKVDEYPFEVFDFDHHPLFTKVQNVSEIIRRPVSESAIIEEMKKCDLRCKNCHKLKTDDRRDPEKLAFEIDLALESGEIWERPTQRQTLMSIG